MLDDLGIAGRGKQMTRVVEILKGEGKLVSSTAKNIVSYNLEVVEETGIAPTMQTILRRLFLLLFVAAIATSALLPHR